MHCFYYRAQIASHFLQLALSGFTLQTLAFTYAELEKGGESVPYLISSTWCFNLSSGNENCFASLPYIVNKSYDMVVRASAHFSCSLFSLLFIHFITILFNEVVPMSLLLMPRRCTLERIEHHSNSFITKVHFSGVYNDLHKIVQKSLLGTRRVRPSWPSNETTWNPFYPISQNRAQIFGA